jgi:error-prone DNA polymerase
MPSPYVELHAHSGFSFLDGASHPEELVLRAKELGYPALALTDHNGLYGSMEFAQAAKEEGLQPITGAEVSIDPGSVPGLERLVEAVAGSTGRSVSHNGGKSGIDVLGSMPSVEPVAPDIGFHLTLLAETPQGYANLCRLLTQAHMEVEDRRNPLLPFPTLLDPERIRGIILLTGCRRSPLWAALQDSTTTGEALLRRLLDAFGPWNVFVELQENSVRGDRTRNRTLARLADRFAVPVVATGNVHYHRPERHRLQDVLASIRNRATLDNAHPMRRPNALFHMASAKEMVQRFRSRPDALSNTLRIAQRCAAFDITEDLGYEFPDFEGAGNGKTATQILAETCRAFMEERYPLPTPGQGATGGVGARPAAEVDRSRSRQFSSKRQRMVEKRREAEKRLEEELRLVEHHGLSGFFLVYRDIMNLAREVAFRVRGDAPRAHSGLPPGRGRGSSVSSIICYLIGLSHIDPVETNLFLGRFLNEALNTVPDIDLDFPRNIREELILSVYEKYGSEHAGLVCTFPTYRLRSAVREIGKVLELPLGDLEKLTKLAEHRSAGGLKEELETLPEFREKAKAPLWQALGGLAEEIAGLPRHLSQHVGGMIISSRPLVEIVPLEPAAWEGRVLCQWDKDSCDDAGFIKIDFLALGMLSLVEEAVDLIAERGTAGAGGEPVVGGRSATEAEAAAGRGVVVPAGTRLQNGARAGDGTRVVHGAPDLSRIDFHDEELYDLICSGDTVGIFQIESRAQMQMIRRVRPRNLADLAVEVALVRPGPIVGGAVNPYVTRRENQRADPKYRIPYEHPLLEEALGETLGVIIYQDQVLKVCKALAGFTDGQAEGLRRAMSRKRSKEAMSAYEDAFLDGAKANGVPEEVARKVFLQVVGFSEFGFPKSHAAAFGLLAYQSAWLRHYYPTEYYVGLFNNQPMGFYSLDALGRDARRHGIETLLPHVNRSAVRCTAEGKDLRIGLGFVRGWGEEIAEVVVAEREANGPFHSLPDFLRRTPAALKRPAIENLIWVGGLDDFGLTRRELLWQAGLWLGPETDPERTGGREDHAQVEMALPDPYAGLPFGGMDAEERMVSEYRMLRFSASLHPLALIRDQLPRGTISSGRLKDLPNGSTVRLAGIVVARQRPQTAKGFVFVLFEDEDGPVNVIVKPDIYQRDRTTIRMEPFVAVRGRMQKDGETINVIAHEVTGLRLSGGGRPPSPRPGPSRTEVASEEEMGTVLDTQVAASFGQAGSSDEGEDTGKASGRPLLREEDLFPALPGTQEWWPDPKWRERKVAQEKAEAEERARKKRERAAQAGSSGGTPAKALPGEVAEDRRQSAQEEATRDRKEQGQGIGTPEEPGPAHADREGAGLPSPLGPHATPELPEVREWWGNPELARKSPFAYLTALRQAPPGTKSWG